MLTVEVGGSRLVLLAQRAAFLPEPGLLLVADVHIGKAQSFRRLGVPVPEATTAGTLARLDAAIEASGAAGRARGIVFLGDLLHSAAGRSAGVLAEVARWRRRHSALEMHLVRGNHDRHAGDPPREWDIACVDEPFEVDCLALVHHPKPRTDRYVLAGHVHPAAAIGGRAHDRLRLPCFHFGPAVGVLPAFGEFTGSQVLPRGDGERVFVVSQGEVRALPGPVDCNA